MCIIFFPCVIMQLNSRAKQLIMLSPTKQSKFMNRFQDKGNRKSNRMNWDKSSYSMEWNNKHKPK